MAWPHDVILGGQNRTRVTYDQLSLTQFAQGFIKNVLEEKSEKIWEKMLMYFADLMEDATDFSWSNAKAANAVILCEMERGRLTWEDSDRLDRLRRAHAQKHSFQKSQNWGRSETRKPWYCKSFQTGVCFHNKDHENGGNCIGIYVPTVQKWEAISTWGKILYFGQKQSKNKLGAALQMPLPCSNCTRIVRSTNCSNTKSLSNSSKKCDLSPTKGVNTTPIAVSPTLARDNTHVKQDGHEQTRSCVITENDSHLVPRKEAHRRVNYISSDGHLFVHTNKNHSNPARCTNSRSRVNDNKSVRVSKACNDNAVSYIAQNATEGGNSQGVGEIEAPNTMRALSYTRLYDINNASSDKYINTLMYRDVQKVTKTCDTKECNAFTKWKAQTDFDFGFVPLSDFIMPEKSIVTSDVVDCPITQHFLIKKTQVPNFLQLNVQKLHEYLSEYWDQQLLQLVTFGFPLDFNRQCVLKANKTNHASAVKHPADIETYLKEEKQYKAILGPFKENPIHNCHYSPFMTRDKPGSENRRVIIDLSWPPDNSVNAGIHKDSYLGTDFSLTFPTVDHITDALKNITQNQRFSHYKLCG